MSKVTQLTTRRPPETATTAPPRPAPAPPAPPRAASGYSFFVGTMKIALPGIAVVLLLLVGVWPQLNKTDERFRLGLSDITPEDARDLRMIRPRYQGVDGRGQPFVITADSAIKKDPESEVVELDSPQADVTLEDGTWIALKADFGAYREKQQTVELVGGVNLFHDAGYEFQTRTARLNIQKGFAEGYTAVVGHGPFGEIRSQGFRILDKGKRVLFLGKTRLVLRQLGAGQDSVKFR